MAFTTIRAASQPRPARGAIDRFFRISARGSSITREIRGGLVTFLTMSYVLVLNPLILRSVPDGTGHYLGGDGGFAKVAAATALIAGLTTIGMGLIANFPLAVGAGMGLNSFVAYTMASAPGMTWADAMGIVVIQGVLILVLVLTRFRDAIFRAVPVEIKLAISVGMGLFVSFIGLVNAGVIRQPRRGASPVELGIGGSLASWPILVFAVGVMLAVGLYLKRVRGAILIAILGSTALALLIEAIHPLGNQTPDNPGGWYLNVPRFPSAHQWQMPNLELVGQFSLLGSWRAVGVVATVLFIFTLMTADFFDTMGTMVAVGGEARLLDRHGNPPQTRRILIADSLGAIAGGVGSTASNTSYIESAAGVADGARTGLASVVTGLAFLASMFLAPLLEMIPREAATPALLAVGFLMISQVVEIDWRKLEVAIPAFLVIIIMPFSYSITAGIGAGIVTYAVIMVWTRRWRAVHPLLWVAAGVFVLYFLRGPIARLVGVS